MSAFPDTVRRSTVYIYDLSGCLVMTAHVDNGFTTVSAEGLAPGIYFLYLACDSMVAREAFVVAGR